MAQSDARKLDHLVLPVSSLAIARERLTALGFTVAPDGHHPFGTANCCVFLADGTFLEPLVVSDAAVADEAIKAGNVFVAQDRNFRQLAGDDGFSALVLLSDDANADQAAFEADGISAGPMLEFTRPFVDASGKSDEAAFRLAFAAEELADETFFFTCQRLRAPAVDRSALQQHANGVSRIDRIILSSPAPEEHVSFLTALLGVEPFETSADVVFYALLNAEIAVLGEEPDEPELSQDAQMRASAVKFQCADAQKLANLLEANHIEHDLADGRVIVPPAPGQGAFFIFESK